MGANNVSHPTFGFRGLKIRGGTPEQNRLAHLAFYGNVAKSEIPQVIRYMLVPEPLWKQLLVYRLYNSTFSSFKSQRLTGKNGCSINNLENQHNVCIKTDPDIGAYNQMISISGRQDDVNVAEIKDYDVGDEVILINTSLRDGFLSRWVSRYVAYKHILDHTFEDFRRKPRCLSFELPKPSATLIRDIVNFCHPVHSVRKVDDIALLDTDTDEEYKRGFIPHEKARIAWLMSRHSCPSCEVNDDISLEETIRQLEELKMQLEAEEKEYVDQSSESCATEAH
ncbi:hypothetical protein KIN20_010273 [Parelaphostrongylus tenuis]|uniref:Uncharacterized protein n=1 Tax=Parelaphostrongylus tenuis TaxID=148309 RepID=A0AAD5M7N3_PARTN|nr:hypothetical protein KIN20_010273 [Parelaphostrongylus tenuis]